MTTRVFAAGILLVSAMAAQQFSYSNSGGSFILGSSLSMTGPMSSPAGTYTFNCPVTSVPPGTYRAEWVCTGGGAMSMQSNDGLTVLTGTVTAGTLVETTFGGVHGVPLTYYYSFSGNFSGALTLNGQAQAVLGITTQASGGSSSPLGSGTLASGTTLMNLHYEPVYITDTYNYRVVRIDDMLGDNFTTLGKYGSGTKQFELPWGLYVDNRGRIYVTDAATCRLIRMDDMRGTNWVSLGTCGSGNRQFNNPGGIFLDSSGNIYVADTGNDRIVQITDMSGAHWVTYGVTGTGTGQLTHPTSVTVNGSGQIYIADGTGRIVRIDNMLGANWTSYSGGGFGGQLDIKLDISGKIYVADTYDDRIVRMDDMLGTNLTTMGGPGSGIQFINPYGVFVDPYGTIYIADSRDYRIAMADDMLGDFFTTYDGSPSAPIFDSPTSMFATPAKSPIAVPAYTASSLTFTDQVVGTVSSAQSITLANIGSAPLLINSIAASGDFQQTNTCGGSVAAGQNCTIVVTFAPTAGGTRNGSITVTYATGAPKTITLIGIGSLVSVSPTVLNFGDVNAGGRPALMTVTVANPGVASAGISSIKLAAPRVYRLKSTCPTSLAVGTSCTLTVMFFPQTAAYYTGKLTVTDASGTAQVVTITGTGVSP
jgi:hypothetical protein